MSFIIGKACVDCMDTACASACPVDCIHGPIDIDGSGSEIEKNGAGEILLTSMDKDGTKSGYDLELTKAISSLVSIPVIASGGVGTLEDLYDGFNQGLASAVLAASIFHYGEYSIMDAKNYLIKKGIPIRI